jgi:hypothetical protein
MTEKCCFGWENRVLSAPLLQASDEVAGLTAGNLQTQHGAATEAWQTPSGVTSASLLIDAGSVVTWRAFLLARTNLTPAATVRWRVGPAEAVIEATPTFDVQFGPGFIAPAGFTCSRAHSPVTALATYFDSAGVMQTAAGGVLRHDTYDPATLESLGALQEPRRVNSIPDPCGEVGSNWPKSAAASVVGTGVEDGIPYTDIRIQGTTPLSTSAVTFAVASTIAASSGEAWSAAVNVRLVAGTLPSGEGESVNLRTRYSTSAAAFAGAKELFIVPTSAPLRTQRFKNENAVAPTTTAWVNVHLWVTTAAACDFTLRVALPQLELGEFSTSPILPPAGAPQVSTRGSEYLAWAGQVAAEEGTLFVEAQPITVGAAGALWRARIDTGSNAVGGTQAALRCWALSPTSAPVYDAYLFVGSTTLLDSVNVSVPGGGGLTRAALTVGPGGTYAWANGQNLASVPGATAVGAAFSRVYLLADVGGVTSLRRLRYYAAQMTSGQVAALSSTGSSLDPAATVYDGGALPGVAHGYGQHVNVAPAEVSGRYARVDISDPTNPDTFLNIPLAFAGPVWTPERNAGWDTNVGRTIDASVVTARSGAEFVTLRYARRQWSVAMPNLTGAEVWPKVMELAAVAQDGTNVLFIPFPNGADMQREAIFGRLSGSSAVTWPVTSMECRAWSATITERL